MDWRSAFIAQAKSDYEVTLVLMETPEIPHCHVLHYLQMSLEKFSKGLMTPVGSMVEPIHSHGGATRLVRFLDHKSPLTESFHRELGMKEAQRKTYLKGLLPDIQIVEQLAPSLATRSGIGINAEYPWLVPASSGKKEGVIAPVEYPFMKNGLKRLPKLIQLLGTIVRSYPA